jgi:hypothetical protein
MQVFVVHNQQKTKPLIMDNRQADTKKLHSLFCIQKALLTRFACRPFEINFP